MDTHFLLRRVLSLGRATARAGRVSDPRERTNGWGGVWRWRCGPRGSCELAVPPDELGSSHHPVCGCAVAVRFHSGSCERATPPNRSYPSQQSIQTPKDSRSLVLRTARKRSAFSASRNGEAVSNDLVHFVHEDIERLPAVVFRAIRSLPAVAYEEVVRRGRSRIEEREHMLLNPGGRSSRNRV